MIEILVATAILALMMTTVIVTLSATFKNSRKAASVGATDSEGMAALRSMENMIKYSKKINICTANNLVIVRVNNDTVTYKIISNQIASQSSTTTYRLTSSGVTATPCGSTMFTCDANLKTVSICFNLENAAAVAGDVTTNAGIGGVQYKSQVTLRNWGI